MPDSSGSARVAFAAVRFGDVGFAGVSFAGVGSAPTPKAKLEQAKQKKSKRDHVISGKVANLNAYLAEAGGYARRRRLAYEKSDVSAGDLGRGQDQCGFNLSAISATAR